MTITFNDAPKQRDLELLPAGTVCTLSVKVRPGAGGDDGWLRPSNDRRSEALDLEFTVVDGEFKKRKLWSLLTLRGTEEGHAQAGEISRGVLRAILESARNIMPSDRSDKAMAARNISGWGDLDGLQFIGRIGIERGTGTFKDKNVLESVITPDRKGYYRPGDAPATAAQAAPAGGATTAPARAPVAPAIDNRHGPVEEQQWAG